MRNEDDIAMRYCVLRTAGLLCVGLAVVDTARAEVTSFELASPDRNVRLTVEVKERIEPYPPGRRLYYSVRYKNRRVLLDSPFGLEFRRIPPLAENLEVVARRRCSVDATWQTVWGASRYVRDHYNELELHLREKTSDGRQLVMSFRAFDDGVAFRYHLPTQPHLDVFQLTAERTGFTFADDHTVWAADISHQEAPFEKHKLDDLKPTTVYGLPLLVKVTGSKTTGTVTAESAVPETWVAISEANLTDWAGMYLTADRLRPSSLVTSLSPRLDDPDVLVESTAPRSSPWRVVMLGDKPGDLVESNIILNLNPPCAIADFTWIRPGRSAWDRWWSAGYAPEVDFPVGTDNRSMKYFIDLAADMGWEYQLVDWQWYGEPFDPQQPLGTAVNPDPTVDLTKSAPGIDIPELVRYAGERGVKILLWVDWYHAEADMEKAFPLYEKWGVAGVKVDFMQRDDQQMVNFYHRLVRLAAKHRLTVDFHGSYKPTGIRRTWPNLLTREGVLGNEWNKWGSEATPTHNVTIPFTRMLAGPMDYTPGGFRNRNREDFEPVGMDTPGPFVMGTRCHQLAMLVVYESPLQVLCDSPYNYRTSSAGLDFLKIVPTTWDETRVLSGTPGDHVAIARRAGDDWFVGAMTGADARVLDLPLDFLPEGSSFRAEILVDSADAAVHPERLTRQQRTVCLGESLQGKLAAGGGYIAHLVPSE